MVKLEDEPGGKTRLNVRWTPHNATEVEQKAFDVSHVGMQATWGGTFDQLTAYWHGRPSTYSAPDSDDVAFRRIDLRVQSGQ